MTNGCRLGRLTQLWGVLLFLIAMPQIQAQNILPASPTSFLQGQINQGTSADSFQPSVSNSKAVATTSTGYVVLTSTGSTFGSLQLVNIASTSASLSSAVTSTRAIGSSGSTPTNIPVPYSNNCFRTTAGGNNLWSVYANTSYSVTDLNTGVTSSQSVGSPSTYCTDLAPGNGPSGLLAMLVNGQLQVYLKANNYLSNFTAIPLSTNGLSLAEQPVQPDYSIMRYYIGNDDGTISTVTIDKTLTVLSTSVQDMTNFGYKAYAAGSSYKVTALAWTNNLLHVGGTQFYTVLDTTNPFNLTMASLLAWGTLTLSKGVINSIRVSEASVNSPGKAWLYMPNYAYMWSSDVPCQVVRVPTNSFSPNLPPLGNLNSVLSLSSSTALVQRITPADTCQSPVCNLTVPGNPANYYSGETNFTVTCPIYSFGIMKVDAAPLWRTDGTLNFTLSPPASNNYTITVNAIWQPYSGNNVTLSTATYYVPPRVIPSAALVSQLATPSNDTAGTLNILSVVAQNATALNSTQVATAVSALTTAANSANLTNAQVSTAITVLNTFVNTDSSAPLVSNYSSAVLSLASASVSVNASTQNLNLLVNAVGTIANSTLQTADSTNLLVALQKTSVAALTASQNTSVILTSANGVVSLSSQSTTSLDLSGGIAYDQAYVQDASKALNTVISPGQKVVTQLLRVTRDLYNVTDASSLGRSRYVAFSLMDQNGNEIPVVNLPNNLTIGIPLGATFNYSSSFNVTNSSTICQYFDTTASVWSQNGCTYDTIRSTAAMAYCQCNHLTTFSAQFKTLSFAPTSITSDALVGLFQNYPVLFSSAAFLLLMFVCMYMAHRYDRRYRLSQAFGAAAKAVLPTLYEMRITNGDRLLHHITLTLHNQSISETYQLVGPIHPLNTRIYRLRGPDIGGITMATLSALKHRADAPSGDMTSTANVQNFSIVNTRSQMHHDFKNFTLALGGQPTCIQPVVSSFLYNTFYERVINLIRQNMPDRHAFLSISLRHKGSAFSSMERTMLCFLLLAANAACGLAWFRGQVDASSSVSFVYKLLLALITGSIVFVGTFPLTLLFRRSRSFDYATSHTALNDDAEPFIKPSAMTAKRLSAQLERGKVMGPRKSGIMRKLLPIEQQWSVGWRYFAWGFTLCAIFGSIVVCALLMNQMTQHDQSMGILKTWSQSFALSLLQSLILTQPLMVVAVSCWRARAEPDQDEVQLMVEEDIAHTKMAKSFMPSGATTMASNVLSTREMSMVSSRPGSPEGATSQQSLLLSPTSMHTSTATLLPTYTMAPIDQYETMHSSKQSVHPLATQLSTTRFTLKRA